MAKYDIEQNVKIGTLIFSTSKGIFKLDMSNSRVTKISDDIPIYTMYNSSMLEYNGYIYYSTRENALKRIDIDGSEEKIYESLKYPPDVLFKYFKDNKFYFPLMLSCDAIDYYMLNLDDSTLTKIFTGIVWDAFFKKDALYIVGLKDYSDNGIYIFDGNNQVCEYHYNGNYLYCDGNWLYFDTCDYNTDRNKPIFYRVSMDFKNKEEIKLEEEITNNDSLINFRKFQDYIYFVHNKIMKNDVLYMLNINNLKAKKILVIKDIKNYELYQNDIYYHHINTDWNHYLGKFDYKNKQILTEISMETSSPCFYNRYIISDEYIYYYLNNEIFRMKTDGTNLEEKLTNLNFEFGHLDIFLLASNWIYINTNKGFYKVKTDGTIRELISEEEVTNYVIIE